MVALYPLKILLVIISPHVCLYTSSWLELGSNTASKSNWRELLEDEVVASLLSRMVMLDEWMLARIDSTLLPLLLLLLCSFFSLVESGRRRATTRTLDDDASSILPLLLPLLLPFEGAVLARWDEAEDEEDCFFTGAVEGLLILLRFCWILTLPLLLLRLFALLLLSLLDELAADMRRLSSSTTKLLSFGFIVILLLSSFFYSLLLRWHHWLAPQRIFIASARCRDAVIFQLHCFRGKPVLAPSITLTISR